MSLQLMAEHHKKRKRFTPQQKFQVLKKWELSGNGVDVAKKYQVHPHTLCLWKRPSSREQRPFSPWFERAQC